MKSNFEELDCQKTHMGELVLRRRCILSLDGREVYEVKLGDEYLMSSLFHDSEVALADIGLGALGGAGWDVVVGGLGLGYTAAAALQFNQVKRLVVVEALAPVIDWHRRGMVPNGKTLTHDGRCVYHHADFFALVRGDGFDPEEKGTRFDAVLLDIDHTPGFWLQRSHADLYSEAGMRRLKSFLKPHGIFALWSNDPPEDAFVEMLSAVFASAEGHTVQFDNPLLRVVTANGVYLAYCG
ncbi:spermidine synthase [Desulfosarcina sp.]|uniref:spermidine synthase n=1 Tax=Desulfosarcina sp. TaxID=2027861 RepID=UPI0029B02F97|nr:spermidine synthase [Desulfosarcina sp.]MDX2453254.1 spermidine synthase [Desulfosarcina sp.]MDX2490977.1 spermidine synthase [Desulfosarcina sp.]